MDFYRNAFNKSCFQQDMIYESHKDIAGRTDFDKVFRDKTFEIASNPKCDGYGRALASVVYNFLISNVMEVVLLLIFQINY